MSLRVSIAVAMLVISVFLRPSVGSAQSAPTTATVTGTVQQSDGSSVSNATVQLTGTTTLTVQSDASGTFVFLNVPYGNYHVVVNVKGLGKATRDHIVVAGDMNVTVRYESTSMNGLRVIASVLAMNRAQISSQPISVTTLTPQTLADQGENTWQHVLNEIPGVAVGLGSNNNISCKNFAQAFPDSPLGAQVLQIGGALPYESSASIDGMPISTQTFTSNGSNGGVGAFGGGSSGVDLSVLAPNAFSQYNVDIGPGADSPSILDSVGGSLDLRAPGYVAKDSANFSISSDPYGGIISNATIEIHRGPFSATVSYGVDNSPGPLGYDVREPFATIGSIYTVNGQPFSCNNNGVFGGCYNRPYIGSPNATGYNMNYGALTDSLVACCTHIGSAWGEHSGSASLFYQISPSITAQLFYEGLQSGQGTNTPATPVTFVPPAGYSGSLSSGETLNLGLNYYGTDISGLGTADQYSNITEEKIGLHLGKRQLTLAALQNRTGDFYQEVFPSSGKIQLWGGGCYFDPATFNCTSPAVFNGGTYAVQSNSGYCYYNLRGYNRDYTAEYSLPLSERYQLKASYVSSYVTQGGLVSYGRSFPPSLPFGSFSVNIPASPSNFNTTQELHFSLGGMIAPKLNVTLSDYFATLQYHGCLAVYTGTDYGNQPYTNSYQNEHFSYQTPRLGIVFQPTDAVAIRASAGGSFTPPPVSNFIGAIGGIFPNNVGNPSIPLLYYSESQNNTALTSESAFGFSLGTDLRLTPRTVFSLDIYRTNLHGQFYSSEYQGGTVNGLPLYIQQVINLAQTKYQGISVQVRHDVSRGWFSQVQFGFTRGYIVALPSGFYNAPPFCNLCANLGTFANVNYPGFPYSQGFGMVGYRWSSQRYVDVDSTYYGPNNGYYRPAFMVFNVNGNFPLTKALSLHATVRNISGIYDQATTIYNAFQNPEIGLPQAAGAAFWQPGLEYGPRTFILRLDAHL